MPADTLSVKESHENEHAWKPMGGSEPSDGGEMASMFSGVDFELSRIWVWMCYNQPSIKVIEEIHTELRNSVYRSKDTLPERALSIVIGESVLPSLTLQQSRNREHDLPDFTFDDTKHLAKYVLFPCLDG